MGASILFAWLESNSMFAVDTFWYCIIPPFQSFGKKKAPAGRRTAQKKKFLKNISKGDMKKGSAKGTKKKSHLR